MKGASDLRVYWIHTTKSNKYNRHNYTGEIFFLSIFWNTTLITWKLFCILYFSCIYNSYLWGCTSVTVVFHFLYYTATSVVISQCSCLMVNVIYFHILIMRYFIYLSTLNKFPMKYYFWYFLLMIPSNGMHNSGIQVVLSTPLLQREPYHKKCGLQKSLNPLLVCF